MARKRPNAFTAQQITDDDVGRAADRLRSINTIDSLQRGRVVFDVAGGLTGGTWYAGENTSWFEDIAEPHRLSVTMPDPRAEAGVWRDAVLNAVRERRRCAEDTASELVGHPDYVDDLAELRLIAAHLVLARDVLELQSIPTASTTREAFGGARTLARSTGSRPGLIETRRRAT